jgi:hypothetical protein
MTRRYSSVAALSVRPVAVTQTKELLKRDTERINSRVHPLGVSVPELDYEPPYRGVGSHPSDGGKTTRLGVSAEWMHKPRTYPCGLLSLYAWSFDDRLTLEGRTFTPGTPYIWNDPERMRRGRKPWAVTLLAVATEHVDRTFHLAPGLMVRLYNGTLMFALPSEVEL